MLRKIARPRRKWTGAEMFEVHCPRHGTRVLLSEGRIRGIANTETGIVVAWRCWCGLEGETRTGRRRPVPAAPSPRPETAA